MFQILIHIKVKSFLLVMLTFLIYTTPVKLIAQNLLIGPESVAFDEQNNRYLVSSFGNSRIIEIDTSGIQDTFKLGVFGCLGNHLEGDILYVSAGNSVKGIDINTREYIMDLPLPGAQQLDGMTADTSGNLYVVGVIARKIYKINLSDHSDTVLVNSGLGIWPQDLIFDKFNNRLLLCSWRANAPIEAINIENGNITTVKETTIGFFDGITMDPDGNVYVSSHSGSHGVYKFDKDFISDPEQISSGHIEPAGLDYNKRDNIIAVPNYGGNTVDFIQITPVTVQEHNYETSQGLELMQNYPNPFNPTTIIQFSLPQTAMIKLDVFNILGKHIIALVNGEKEKGSHSVSWDGNKANSQAAGSGVYIYRISAGIYAKTKSMILVK